MASKKENKSKKSTSKKKATKKVVINAKNAYRFSSEDVEKNK